jgi:hypothetical protein
MAITEGVKGIFDWSVAGLEKLNAMEQRLASLETHMEKRLPEAAKHAEGATAKLGQSHVVSGEKLARYGTSVGMLTGQMQGLGIQNDLVTRGIQIGSEALTGMLGPVGMVTVAVGALAAGIAYLVNQHRENEQAIKDSTAAMEKAIEVTVRMAGAGAPGDTLATMRMYEMRDATSAKLATQQSAYSAMLQSKEAGGFTLGGKLYHAFDAVELAKVNKSIDETTAAIAATIDELGKLYTIEDTYKAPSAPAESAVGTKRFDLGNIGPTSPGSTGARFPKLSNRFGLGKGIGVSPLPGDAGTVDKMIREGQDAYAVLAEAAKGSADVQTTAMQYVFSTHAKGYAAMSALTQSTQKASSMFVQRALEGENVQRLKGVTVARYAASGMAAAVIRQLGQEAEKKAAYQAAEAIAAYASGNIPGGVGHTAAAAAYAALAGGAAGVAAGMESTAQRKFDQETTRSGQSSGTAAGNGIGGTSSVSNPGVRIAASGASVGTVNYNFIVTYQGATVYGDGGTRDWFYRELVPLINEGLAVGSISTN